MASWLTIPFSCPFGLLFSNFSVLNFINYFGECNVSITDRNGGQNKIKNKTAIVVNFVRLVSVEKIKCKASPRGSTFQAMVSVMAVKIQLSSPRGVRLSLSLPGILHHTQHNTDGSVSAALTVCPIVDSEHKVATAQYYYHNTSEDIYIYRQLGSYSERLTMSAGLNIHV